MVILDYNGYPTFLECFLLHDNGDGEMMVILYCNGYPTLLEWFLLHYNCGGEKGGYLRLQWLSYRCDVSFSSLLQTKGVYLNFIYSKMASTFGS